MAYNRENDFVVNEEQIASFLSDALKNLEGATENEIQALNKIKKLFKKNVGWSRRNYIAALLIKQGVLSSRSRYSRGEGRPSRDDHFSKGERFNRSERSERHSRSSRNEKETRRENFTETQGEHEKAPRVQIAQEAAGTIFIGIGRNRHVYPRDLVGLLISVAGLERDRIGDIRVLANYSFIQLYKEDCDKAISALNGYDYRGRKLTVNLSRMKDESAESSSQEAGAAQDEKEDTIPSNVTNEAHSSFSSENAEEAKIASEQSEFAARQSSSASSGEESSSQQFSETTEDGQVKSHFGSGAAY